MGILEEKAALLDLLYEATNDGVVDWDLVGKRTHYNERWRFLLGWDEADFVLTQDSWRDLIHPDERPAVEKAITDHLEEGWPFVQTVRMRHRGLGWRWILMRGTAQRNAQGEPRRMIIIFADIDERVRAESQVRALVEAIPDTILRVRLDGTLLAVKEGNRLGSPVSEQGDGSHGLFAAIRASDVGKQVMECIETVGQRQEVVQIPCRLHEAGAEPKDYDIRIVRSGVDEAVCIVRDITREKGVEEQLARGRKLEAIGQLAAGLAHEINTPLQYIADNVQFARDAVPSLLSLLADFHKLVRPGEAPSAEAVAALLRQEEEMDLPYLNDSLESALVRGLDGLEHIARIVHAMKTFENIGQQSRTLVDLNPMVENATLVATRSWSQYVEVSMELDPGLPLVPCVAGEIAQVVLNLVINAAQAIAD